MYLHMFHASLARDIDVRKENQVAYQFDLTETLSFLQRILHSELDNDAD